MAYRPISDYGVIGDMHSAALVSCDGSVDWLCFPRFDSPSVFAAILDDERGGRFWIRPGGDFTCRQHYQADTNILVTEMVTDSGRATLIDFMPVSSDVRLGAHQLVRIVVCREGTVDFVATFEPRLDYARQEATLEFQGAAVIARTAEACLSLTSLRPFAAEGAGIAASRFSLKAGEETAFVVHWDDDTPPDVDSYDPAARFDETERFWRSVAEDWTYDGRFRALVRRSMLALHLLIYAPTGAVCAAATTSLPEKIGGVRNWDYRFTWLRDAAFTFDVFHLLGHTEWTGAFLEWIGRQLADLGPGHQVHTLYEIVTDAGPHGAPEEILEHFDGYRGSRPVRIGNAAYHQLQLDVFGEVVLAVYSYHRAGGQVDDHLWRLAEQMIESAAQLWREPDLGIWEFRTEPRDFTYSKLMCWVALDRGLKLATALGRTHDLPRWQTARDQVREAILTRGWNEERGSFTQYLGGDSLDASLLFLPMVGFLPGDDPRINATIDAIRDELAQDGLLYRYLPEVAQDGLPGDEGTFTMCSLWMVGALVAAGRVDEAAELFDRITSLGNHVGVYSEMLDPRTGESLGNYPQAFTHIALIQTALNLDRALGTSA